MIILDAIRNRRLGGVALDHDAWQRLVQSSFHIMHCTVEDLDSSADARLVDRALSGASSEDDALKRSVPVPKHKMGEEKDWVRRLVWAIANIEELPVDYVRAHSSQANALKSLGQSLRQCAQMRARCVYDEGVTPKLNYYASDWLPRYRDFGILQPQKLAVAITQHIQSFKLIPNSRSASIELGYGVSILVLETGFVGAAALLHAGKATIHGRMLSRLDGIEAWAERTLELLDSADSVAAAARRENVLTEVFRGTMLAHFLYEVARRSLTWILARYSNAGVSPPADLEKENQIVEENRVETLEVLATGGGSWIFEPASQLMSDSLMQSRRGSVSSDFARKALLDGMCRNPAYPDVLRPAWDLAFEELELGRTSCDTFEKWLDASVQLQPSVHARLPELFSDSDYASEIAALMDRWSIPHLSSC